MPTLKIEDIMPALEQIERLHKVPKNEVIKYIESAITAAASKFFGSDCKIETKINLEKVEIQTFIIKKVVEVVTNDHKEISLEEAKKILPDVKIGDEVKIVVNSESFKMLAAKTAKRVVIQRLNESYKRNIFEEYSSKIGKIVTGVVYAIRGKTVILTIDNLEGIIPQREQVFKEKFKINQEIKVLIKDVERTRKGIRIIASRFDKNFIKELFSNEIPEIKDNIIEIVKIVRAAGHRTKIILKSNNPKIDPVGSCVGIKGARIKTIIEELQGEKIDLVPYTENIEKLIAYSLVPWKVEKVEIEDKDKKIAKVYLSKNLYDFARSKGSININLAKELTGWDIRILLSETTEEKNEE
ncbi:MAG: transcription termination factor NusA [Endomicrobia bacterium]|nr:transcription termination factor NusA [Endomicrobiia bacterium]